MKVKINSDLNILSYLCIPPYSKYIRFDVRCSYNKKLHQSIMKEFESIPEILECEYMNCGMAGTWLGVELNIDWRKFISEEEFVQYMVKQRIFAKDAVIESKKMYDCTMKL